MTRPSVTVLDYGSGNLRSAERALQRAGAEVRVSADPAPARDCDGLVVPGVGAFAACRGGLTAIGADAVVRERVAAGAPVLGICVGMQVLFASGEEHGVATDGLGLLPGAVRRLTAPVLPHMGWNTLAADPDSRLFAGADPDERYYFVHSYAAVDPVPGAVLTYSEHGSAFLAAVERGPLSATQFHPEKSGDAGARVLANWVRGLAG